MPLPPALAARLKKRGLLKVEDTAEPDEEIIAEDYSGENENEPPEEEELQILINNTNLPSGWWKVKDPKSGLFYYWDSETDKVQWTSPEVISEPEVPSQLSEIPNIPQMPPGMIGPMVGPVVGPTVEQETAMKRPKAPRQSKRRDERESKRRKKREDELDPMDPASYSDVPRGTWSTGLPKTNEAKTGVDSTATGPLFQMRPYPSPGAVLRANAAATNKEDDEG